jgi:hypothetical protein
VAVKSKAAEDDITYKHPVGGQHLQRLKGLVTKNQHQYNMQNKTRRSASVSKNNNKKTKTKK